MCSRCGPIRWYALFHCSIFRTWRSIQIRYHPTLYFSKRGAESVNAGLTKNRDCAQFVSWNVQYARVLLICFLVGLSVYGLGAEMAKAETPEENPSGERGPEAPEESLFNLQLPTAGGKQFWTDHRWRNGWRIQQNAITGHWRLLDPGNVRVAWGSRAACEQELDRHPIRLKKQEQRYIVLIHGLFRSSGSMLPLKQVLETQALGQVVLFEYASSRAAINDHADALREVVAGLSPEAVICFVGHSMGNIVFRHAVADWKASGDPVLQRLQSVVMLGPPNQGAAIARQLAKLPVYGWLAGKGGLELGPEWEQLQQRLGTPPCPVGIIAGRLPEGFTNPLIGEAGDFIVSVDETRLPGAEVLEVNQLHSLLMDDPEVQHATIAFIKNQHFPTED